MKKLLAIAIAWSCCSVSFGQSNDKKINDTTFLQPIEVTALRAADKDPFAKTTIQKNEIEKQNLGQDLPFLLSNTPSAVVTSDAGNGIGYTGIRIRGTDASRVNVTINGIPYNDAENQGTFFVNLPDFSSSVNSIQVQRGAGTSSNGAGAFGATINMETNTLHEKFYANLNNSFGSYNSMKNTFQFGSGLINKHFTIDGRMSQIKSDGYVDRASSDLKSFYISTAYTDQDNSIRLNIFSGKEKTYQAWNGIDEQTLQTNRTYNSSGQQQPGTPYANETDNYKQTHYQLFFNRKLNNYWQSNIALFATTGKGYYEEYRANQTLINYGLSPYFNGTNVITESDLIRQLWLDNIFYGTTYSFKYNKNNNQVTMGGAYTIYEGNHFGKVLWTKVPVGLPADYTWYNLTARKNDFSFYTKWTRDWSNRLKSYFDVQVRSVQYNINGFRNNPDIRMEKSFGFVNPKLGLTYNYKSWQFFGSYAIASKEPNRDDFEAGINNTPSPETLFDWELGMEKKHKKYNIGVNLFYMKYKNQLVLTGKINDVGAYTRSNIRDSYRAGIELQGKYVFNDRLSVSGNITLSENKVLHFEEFIDDYDNGGQVSKQYQKTDISFSPKVTANGLINIVPFKDAEISLMNKFVSRQFLDNTSQVSRSINEYFIQDIRMTYELKKKFFKSTQFMLQLNNIFNKLYVSNGYTFSYIYGGPITENYYYPMAPFNFMAGINISL